MKHFNTEVEQIVNKFVENSGLLWDLINTGYGTPLSIKDLACLPDMAGIYVVAGTHGRAIESLEQIIYIGVATKSIRSRWGNHHKMQVFNLLERVAQEFYNDNYESFYLGIFCWVNPFANAEFLLLLENYLIKRLQPHCNQLQIGKRRDSEIEELFLRFLENENNKE